MTAVHLWDIQTHWINNEQRDLYNTNYNYKSWSDFRECCPYRMWKPYFLTSWSWKDDKLQLVFCTPYKDKTLISYVEIPVKQQDEDHVRLFIKKHMPQFWVI